MVQANVIKSWKNCVLPPEHFFGSFAYVGLYQGSATLTIQRAIWTHALHKKIPGSRKTLLTFAFTVTLDIISLDNDNI